MRLNTLYAILFVLSFGQSFAQEKFQLTGKTISNDKAVENVHIINISTSIGTISSDLGLFRISAKVGDTLLVSSLAHERLKITVTNKIQEEKFITIPLKPTVVALDEMTFTGLTGNLEYDLQQMPKDTIPEIGWKYSPSDLYKKLQSDELMNQSKVNADDFVNPIYIRGGGGGGVGIPDKRLLREQRLKRTLKLKKEFSDKLIKEFGISYFTVTLGIQKEEIPKFISFCEPLNIFEKYRNNEILEVIEILKTESKNYHDLED